MSVKWKLSRKLQSLSWKAFNSAGLHRLAFRPGSSSAKGSQTQSQLILYQVASSSQSWDQSMAEAAPSGKHQVQKKVARER